MRPSGREKDIRLYCEFYLPQRRRRRRTTQPQRQIVAQSFEPSVDAFHKNGGSVNGMARWVSVVALCPLLELEDSQETTALGRLKRRGWRGQERANLIGLPAENTKYYDMVLSDPPVHEVEVELTYKHSLKPLLMIRGKRFVSSPASPLTIAAVLSDACGSLSHTYLHEPPMPSNNYNASHAFLPAATIKDLMAQKVQEYGSSFALDLTNTQFIFRNRVAWVPQPVINRIVVPNAKEMMEMEASRAQGVTQPSIIDYEFV